MYQKSAQDRNDLGLQLIERNEEVSVFYEKANMQESIIKKGNIQLEACEEEIKILNLEVRGDGKWSSLSLCVCMWCVCVCNFPEQTLAA